MPVSPAAAFFLPTSEFPKGLHADAEPVAPSDEDADAPSLRRDKRTGPTFADAMQALLAGLPSEAPGPMRPSEHPATLPAATEALALTAGASDLPVPSPLFIQTAVEASQPMAHEFVSFASGVQPADDANFVPKDATEAASEALSNAAPTAPNDLAIAAAQESAAAAGAGNAIRGDSLTEPIHKQPAPALSSNIAQIAQEHAPDHSETPSAFQDSPLMVTMLESMGDAHATAQQQPAATSADFLVRKDLRSSSKDATELARDSTPASMAGHGATPLTAPAHPSLPVSHATNIVQQIQDAILARFDESQLPGRTEITVRLNPPELGQVRVHLLSLDDRVTGRLVVQDEAVRTALESQLPELRQKLEQAGIDLGRFDVARDNGGQGNTGHQRWAPFAESVPPLPFHDRPASQAVDREHRALARSLIDLLA